MGKKVLTACLALAVAASAIVATAQQYRERGVTISGYEVQGHTLFIMCDVWDPCPSGRFTVGIDYELGQRTWHMDTTGQWRNGATSVTLRVFMSAECRILALAVTGVWPDC